jgi:predicted permease
VAIGARLLSLEGEYLAFFLLAKDFRPSPLFRWRAISCIAVARFVINPLLTSTILHMVTTRTNLLGPTDSRTCAVLSFVILMQGCMPPAQNSVVMLQMENQTGRATRMTTLLTILYCLAIVPVTFHTSRTLAATGVTAF